MPDDIKKLLSIMNETTTSGAVAPVAGGMGKSMLKRPADSIFAAESIPQDADTGLEAAPKVDSPANFEYWKNSATVAKEQSGKHGRNKTKKYPQLKETRDRRDAYQRDYDKTGTSRITIGNKMGGNTQDARTSDLKRVSEAVQINDSSHYDQRKVERHRSARRVDPASPTASSRGYDSNERNFPVHAPEKKTPAAVIHIGKNELEEGIDKDNSNLDPYKHVSNRVSNPKIHGTENRAKSAYYPPAKPPVKKLDKPLPKSEQLDELSPKTLADYKKKAGADATAADNRDDHKRGHKRFKGIMKATRKEFDNDEKLKEEYSEWDGTGDQDLAAATAASGYEAGFADIEDKTSLSEAEITEEMIADRLKNELALFKKGTKSKDKSIGKKPADKEVQPKDQKKESDEPKTRKSESKKSGGKK